MTIPLQVTVLKNSSLRKQTTFRDATNSFPAKRHLRNERRNSILMTCHYPDLGSVSNWLKQFSQAARPIRSTTQIWVVKRHQYGISTLVSQTSFHEETVGGITKCCLFSHTIKTLKILWFVTCSIKLLPFVPGLSKKSELGKTLVSISLH